jgi:hypothetical protein
VSLVCPACGREHPPEERFCVACGMPLVAEGGPAEHEPTEVQERARKIKRQFSEGELVRVAVGRQQPEAEFIQNLLLDAGVPSTLSRTRGFDVPEMLAAGPRDVMVPQSGLEVARDVLLQAELLTAATAPPLNPARIFAFVLVAFLVVAVIIVVIDLLVS